VTIEKKKAYLRHAKSPTALIVLLIAAASYAIFSPISNPPVMLALTAVIIVLVVGLVDGLKQDDLRKVCMIEGTPVQGIVIELRDGTARILGTSSKTVQALVEYKYEGEVRQIWTDHVHDREFKIEDVFDVYMHPSNRMLAHVYLPIIVATEESK
jgi:hypothetical protein